MTPREFNLIQKPDLQQRLARGLDIVGESSPARTLDPTVQAVVLLEDLTKQSPFVQPVARRGGGLVVQPGVAAEFGSAHLVNPSGSGAIVVPLVLWLSAATSIDCRWGIGTSVLPGTTDVGGTTWLDLRNGFGATQAILMAGTDPGHPSYIAVGVSHTPSAIPVPAIDVSGFVLRPGDVLTVDAQSVATEIRAGFEWLEYYE